MATCDPGSFNQIFHDEMNSIRLKIESLPAEMRPHFQQLADDAENLHHEMQAECEKMRDMIDDMRMNEITTAFDAWAAAVSVNRTLGSASR